MKIVAGIYKGRRLKRVESSQTRETSDKVKQAVFNMLFDVNDQVVVDMFSGSGQYALEAISRGASHAFAIDHQKEALMTILDNASDLGCQKQLTLIEATITPNKEIDIDRPVDIIIMDPPYNFEHYKPLIESLPMCKKLIVETSIKTDLPEKIGTFHIKKEKKYGKKKVYFYTT